MSSAAAPIALATHPSSVSAGSTLPEDPSAPEPVRGLYVHVPFCAHKCEYCAFYSAPPSGDVLDRYVGALVRELELIAPSCRPDTVFFGGGTPSILTLRQWETILTAMERLNLLGAAEWTVECNPATVSADKAALLRRYGVNRISMGVQSLDASLLERLGRIHSRDQVFRSFDILRAAGFDNLNIDLMFAIPGQTLELWHRTLDEALALGTEHLSCYEVIYEDDTPLFHQLQAGEFDVDEALACSMYDALIDRCAADGLRQYEIANFARDARVTRGPREVTPTPAPTASGTPTIPALACRHNVGYWRGRDYFGVGPSASEAIGGKRSKNWSNTNLWIERLERGRRAQEWSEGLTPLGRAGELAAFGLRMNAGWPFEEFQRRTGHDLRGEWRSNLDTLLQRGWAEETAEAFRLNRTGLRFADSAAEMMLR
jgi:oxygen-independent coproporphyrinogen-3 oxidase